MLRKRKVFRANEKKRILRQTRYESLLSQILEDTAAEKEQTSLLESLRRDRSDVKAKQDLYLSFKKKWGKFAEEKEKINQLYQLKDRIDELDKQIQSIIVLDEFDSALDEGRKVKVFDLYVKEQAEK